MNRYTEKIIRLASKWYSKGKLAHVFRVAGYAIEETYILGYSEEDRELIFEIAILHDILEDTECPEQELNNIFANSLIGLAVLDRLTHRESESFDEYISRLSYYTDNNPKAETAFAYIIKRADIKDHIEHKEDLDNKLKDKYFPAIKNIL